MPGYYLFGAGISALQAQSRKFDTIRGNIENQTVPGYKAADVRFQDMVATRGEQRTEQLLGVRARQQVFLGKEGEIIPTGNRFDGAITGSGFFVTRPSFENNGDVVLTDAGAFNETLVNVDGEERVYLTDLAGNFLLGYNADPATGQYTVDTSSANALEPIEVTRERALSVAQPTTVLSLRGNLSPDTEVGKTEQFTFTVLDGTGDADGLGDEQLLNFNFTKTANPDEWDLEITAPNGAVSQPTNQPMRVVFNADGEIESIGGASGFNFDVAATWDNSQAQSTIAVNLGRFSQYQAVTSIETVNVDGNSDGFLTDVYFGDDGKVMGDFSNGISRAIGQLALGDVVAPERLSVLDDNHYRLTANSGDLNLYDFTTSNRAAFQGFALEQSTTEISEEFTNLIVTQRAYSSAAQTIRTVDEMMQTATNLKN
ncbi:flagellar hook-basal body complex protein [Marivibrio halodurans]|uniref:Flagellar hook protein FlgE n=1 Tax=Marivibrio halodurans TaxID=2039722 RepID=A0A8J7S5M4_9PROT|nr:flagellar hook-basal body complex protein [Marivibrio halodurans]MBP5856012.1 flagellar hook-basal body complex protein [Marivibrio halodurans]